jgi:hypothetical protein
MKKRLVSSLACFALSLTAAIAAPKTDDGFVSLFNGKNLDGWTLKTRGNDAELAKKLFAVEDGVIHVFNKDFPDNYELNTGGNKSHAMMFTEKKYTRYIFPFEYKWGKKKANNFKSFQYDAGCYYHAPEPKIWPAGIEFQVRYNNIENRNHTGDFWSPPTTKIQWYSKDGTTFALPTAGGLDQPYKKGEHRALTTAPFHGLDGEWNTCELIAMGGEYAIHKLNGVVVNLATDLNPGTGLIGLQAETGEIFYRNISIKELPASVPMETFLK